MEPRTDQSPASTQEPLPEAPLRAIVEAILFASEEPVTIGDMAVILGEERTEEIAGAVRDLEADYPERGSGLRVQRLAGGYRITTDPSLAPFVREMVRSRNVHRLSRAALETLAVVAYKQPITAPEIQEIRGVNPSSILNSLLERRMVRILGRKRVVGKPFLYGTTDEFMIRFGLNSLDDLPSMEEFRTLLQPEESTGHEPSQAWLPAGEAAPAVEPDHAEGAGLAGSDESP